MGKIKDVSLAKIQIDDGFWSERQNLIADVVIPFQEKVLNDEVEGVEKSHALANFRIAAGLEEGEFYGMVFQDSDVAKWLEGVAYSLVVKPDPELEQRVDAIVDVIEKAQQEDGYLNTYFTIKEPEHRWQNLHECHELYCAGHMMEAAVAYYDATGKEKYRDLAQYFLDERGKNPNFFKEEKEKRGWTHFGLNPDDTKYNQSFAPIREQKTAEGHSVRAVYMYTAMADLAGETGEEALLKACETLWDNITQKRMYLTGGIGSTGDGEAFSIDYDLPNDMAYAETCASIGLAFYAKNMLNIWPSNKYADVLERTLYNGILSGMQLDGKRFFYVNPLEVNPGISGKLHGFRHVLPERPGWYACACCPPNLVRTVMSLGKYAWSESDDTIYSHLYVGGSAELEKATVEVKTTFPWEGSVKYTVHPKKSGDAFTLAVRIPSYVKNPGISLNGTALCESSDKKVETKEGYLYLSGAWTEGETLSIEFEMPVRRIYCNTAVRENENCVALMRGPFVYCFEGVDNDMDVQELRIPEGMTFEAELCQEGVLKGMVEISGEGIRVHKSGDLYTEEKPVGVSTQVRAIPYFAWGNRGANQMKVWMQE